MTHIKLTRFIKQQLPNARTMQSLAKCVVYEHAPPPRKKSSAIIQRLAGNESHLQCHLIQEPSSILYHNRPHLIVISHGLFSSSTMPPFGNATQWWRHLQPKCDKEEITVATSLRSQFRTFHVEKEPWLSTFYGYDKRPPTSRHRCTFSPVLLIPSESFAETLR